MILTHAQMIKLDHFMTLEMVKINITKIKEKNLIFIIYFCSFRMHSISHEIKITHIVIY